MTVDSVERGLIMVVWSVGNLMSLIMALLQPRAGRDLQEEELGCVARSR